LRLTRASKEVLGGRKKSNIPWMRESMIPWLWRKVYPIRLTPQAERLIAFILLCS